jgi:acetyl esterase/lipase
MDIYLPAGRDPSVSKVIVFIHGGGWGAGNKEDMNGFAYWFYINFPQYGIVNLGYRLRSINNGYPKQIYDITLFSLLL